MAQLTVPEVSLLVDNNLNSKQSQGASTANRLWNQNPPSAKSVTFESDYLHRNTLTNQIVASSAALSSGYQNVDTIEKPTISKLNNFATNIRQPLIAFGLNENKNPISQFGNPSTTNTNVNSNSGKTIKDIYYELLAQGRAPLDHCKEPTLEDIHKMLKSNNNSTHPQIQHGNNSNNAVHNLLNRFQKATEINLKKMIRQINKISQQTQMMVDYILTHSDSLNGNLFLNENLSPELSESTDDEEENDFKIEANHNQKICKNIKASCSEFCSEKTAMSKGKNRKQTAKKHSVKNKQLSCTLPAQSINKKSAAIQSHNKTVSMCPDRCHHTRPNVKPKPKTKSSSDSESCSCSESNDERQPIEKNKLKDARKRDYNLPKKQQNCVYYPQSKNLKQKCKSESSETDRSLTDHSNAVDESNSPVKNKRKQCKGQPKFNNTGHFSHQKDEYERKKYKTKQCNQSNTKVPSQPSNDCGKRSDVDCSFYGNILEQVNDVLENSPILNCRWADDSRTPQPQLESYSNQQR